MISQKELDALTEADLAHGEIAAHAPVRAGNAHAFEILDALARAFDDLHTHAQRIARAELGNVLRGLGDLFRLDLLDQVHWSLVLIFAPRARGRLAPSAPAALPKVRPA